MEHQNQPWILVWVLSISFIALSFKYGALEINTTQQEAIERGYAEYNSTTLNLNV